MAKKKQPKTPAAPKRIVKMELPVKLSADEVSRKARDFAAHHAEYVRLKDDYKDEQRRWRDRIKQKEGVLVELGKQVDDECRPEMVECTETYDFDHDRIRVTRNDTDEVVAIREASAAEKEAFEAIDLQQRQGDLLAGDDDAAEDGDDAAAS